MTAKSAQSRAARVWARAVRLARRVRELFPVTAFGVLAAGGAALAVAHYGFARFDLVLLVIGAATAGACALSLVSVVVAAAALALSWRARAKRTAADGAKAEAALRVDCGVPTETGATLPALRFIPFVRLRLRFEEPTGDGILTRKGGRYSERARLGRRAEVDALVRAIDVSDAFGFCRITLKLREARAALALPNLGALRRVDVSKSLASGDAVTHPLGPPEGDRADMRGYAPGDPTRLILWKVFARRRELVVRTPERALSPAKKTCAYLVTGPDDEAAAAAARLAIESGALGTDWVFGADGSTELARMREAALRLVARSGRCTNADGARELANFLQRAAAEGASRVLLFVPPARGEWLARATSALRPGLASRTTAIVGLDGVPPAVKLGRLRRAWHVLARPEAARPGARAFELGCVTQTLSRLRVRLLIVDRERGRITGGDAFQALAEQAGAKSNAGSPNPTAPGSTPDAASSHPREVESAKRHSRVEAAHGSA